MASHRDCLIFGERLMVGNRQRSTRNMGSFCSHEVTDRSLCPCNLKLGGKGPGLVPMNLSTHMYMANIPVLRGKGGLILLADLGLEY